MPTLSMNPDGTYSANPPTKHLRPDGTWEDAAPPAGDPSAAIAALDAISAKKSANLSDLVDKRVALGNLLTRTVEAGTVVTLAATDHATTKEFTSVTEVNVNQPEVDPGAGYTLNLLSGVGPLVFTGASFFNRQGFYRSGGTGAMITIARNAAGQLVLGGDLKL